MNPEAEVCKAFDTHAFHYEKTAVIQAEIGERLFERLAYLKIEPRFILDLGCGPGVFSKKLKRYYPKAQIIGLDIAAAMLQEAQRKQGWRNKWSLVNADMSALPFPSGLFDLVFANQAIHWSNSLAMLMREISRVMNVNGCLMFSTLGPGTFSELKMAWEQVDNHSHINDFLDMHDIGDALLAEHFLDPVVDSHFLKAHYKSFDLLITALKYQGVRNVNTARNAGLTSKSRWQRFEAAFLNFKTSDGKFPLTYEVVYGHAWKGAQQRLSQGTETRISIESLRRR